MDLQKLCGALRRGSVDAHRCLGCSYEDNCSIHGCRMMKLAAEQLEALRKQVLTADSEKKACFSLGQLDMRESIVAMLTDTANATSGGVRVTALMLADVVQSLEVGHGVP